MIKKSIKCFRIMLALTPMLLIYTFSNAQVLDPVKWEFKVEKVSKVESELIFTAKIDKGWHLYSQHLEEGGPIPTSFTFEKAMGYFMTDKVTEPKAIEVFDKQFDMKVKYFSGEVEFRQKVKVVSNKPVEIKGNVSYMCCNDESCLPPVEKEFSFELPATK